MTEQKVFSISTNVYTQFYSYIKEVIEEIGLERALELLTKTNEDAGRALGKKTKEEHGGKEFDVQNTAHMIIKIAKGIGGIDKVMVDNPQEVMTKTGSGKCPNYEAARAAGLDNDTIKALCAAGSLRFFDTFVKELNPNLSYQLKKFRSGADDFCLEETVLVDKSAQE